MVTKSRARSRKKKVAVTKIVSSKNPFKWQLHVVFKNLAIFLALLVISLVMFYSTGGTPYESAFFLLIIIFSFVSLAFLLVALVLFFLRLFRKNW